MVVESETGSTWMGRAKARIKVTGARRTRDQGGWRGAANGINRDSGSQNATNVGRGGENGWRKWDQCGAVNGENGIINKLDTEIINNKTK